MCKLAKRLGDPTDRDEALQELHQALRHADGDAADEAFEAFHQDPNTKVLVAHPQTAAHGLTLVEADTTIWFGPTYNAEHYEQANNRMNRPGQTHNMTIIHLYSTPFEKNIYAATQNKVDFQESVLGIFKDFTG